MSILLARREFIAGLGGAAAAWPLTARAQQSLPLIGVLIEGTIDDWRDDVVDFRRGLAETGYVEGQNVAIEIRASNGQTDKLPALAADLVRHRVMVIVAENAAAVRAAKAATTTIPIVFSTGSDPVKLGFVSSFNRPRGNVTGVTFWGSELAPKRLGLLRELVPNATRIATLVDPSSPTAEYEADDLLAAGRSLGLVMDVVQVNDERDIDRFFATLVQRQASALIVGSQPLFERRRQQIVALAADHAIPAIYGSPLVTEAGGLMSYGHSRATDSWMARQIGVYTGQILKGAKPTDLPVVLPTKFEFAINLKTAKALGLTVPPTLLAIADEVIE